MNQNNPLLRTPQSFKKQEADGLLSSYGQEETALENVLTKRRQKLAESKLHLAPSLEDVPTIGG